MTVNAPGHRPLTALRGGNRALWGPAGRPTSLLEPAGCTSGAGRALGGSPLSPEVTADTAHRTAVGFLISPGGPN